MLVPKVCFVVAVALTAALLLVLLAAKSVLVTNTLVPWKEYRWPASSKVASAALINLSFSSVLSNENRRLQEKRTTHRHEQVLIFTNSRDGPFAKKQREMLREQLGGSTVVVSNSTEQQHNFLLQHPCVEGAAQRFEMLAQLNQTHLAEELWKYCALFLHGGLYVDSHSPILNISELKHLIFNKNNGEDENGRNARHNIAVLMDSFAPSSISGSLLFLRRPQSTVALGAAKVLVNTKASVLISSPLLLPLTLYDLIIAEAFVASIKSPETNNETTILQGGVNGPWQILLQSCTENPFRWNSQEESSMMTKGIHTLHTCSRKNGLCCLIYKGTDQERVAVFGSRIPIHPVLKISYSDLPKSYRAHDILVSNQDASRLTVEMPYIATLQRQESSKGTAESLPTPPPVPTFYERLKQKDCLPSHSCNKCLSDKKHGATCETCSEECPCYCKVLCQNHDSSAKDTQTFQDIVVRAPCHRRDPTRLIPRIVHQTWFEDLDPRKYPNMSRLTESFKASGWEYQFYTDDQAASFLSEHFPSQVREAYELLVPGAFKADLFRYCVLLIRGGVYADVDTMMGPSLDAAIPNDVGFMVGLDEPGKTIGKRMCLWNGFIAAAPGHPFLAKVIESVVNNVHQRFTSVDVARLHCPMPEMSIITSFSPLFVAGPCMLGSTINTVLGRHGQTQFEAGELINPNHNMAIPGRTIILKQNKMDMGAHRFTFAEQDLIVLSTDFPDSDDRQKLDDSPAHYSTTRIKFEIYGIDGVYGNSERTNNVLVRLNME